PVKVSAIRIPMPMKPRWNVFCVGAWKKRIQKSRRRRLLLRECSFQRPADCRYPVGAKPARRSRRFTVRIGTRSGIFQRLTSSYVEAPEKRAKDTRSKRFATARSWNFAKRLNCGAEFALLN